MLPNFMGACALVAHCEQRRRHDMHTWTSEATATVRGRREELRGIRGAPRGRAAQRPTPSCVDARLCASSSRKRTGERLDAAAAGISCPQQLSIMPTRILILFSVIALARRSKRSDAEPPTAVRARFSKKYRDAAGIDDSKWTNDGGDGGGGFADLLPTTPQGWFTALLALGAIAVLWPRRRRRPPTAAGTRSAPRLLPRRRRKSGPLRPGTGRAAGVGRRGGRPQATAGRRGRSAEAAGRGIVKVREKGGA